MMDIPLADPREGVARDTPYPWVQFLSFLCSFWENIGTNCLRNPGSVTGSHRTVYTHWYHLLCLYWFGDFDHPDESPGAVHSRYGVVHSGGFPQHHVSLIRCAHTDLSKRKHSQNFNVFLHGNFLISLTDVRDVS